jgi:peptidoglycan/LPS O-acetylase OafA/YrhL
MTDPRPTPRVVIGAFVVFVGVLFAAAGALISGRPNILPWPATQEVATLTGIIFLGAASYFLFGLARRGWSNAGGQLAGFLAYDLVLIPPLMMRSGTVPGYWRDSLWAYLAVLIGSGVLAAWYLFLDPRTRLGARRGAVTPPLR